MEDEAFQTIQNFTLNKFKYSLALMRDSFKLLFTNFGVSQRKNEILELSSKLMDCLHTKCVILDLDSFTISLEAVITEENVYANAWTNFLTGLISNHSKHLTMTIMKSPDIVEKIVNRINFFLQSNLSLGNKLGDLCCLILNHLLFDPKFGYLSTQMAEAIVSTLMNGGFGGSTQPLLLPLEEIVKSKKIIVIQLLENFDPENCERFFTSLCEIVENKSNDPVHRRKGVLVLCTLLSCKSHTRSCSQCRDFVCRMSCTVFNNVRKTLQALGENSEKEDPTIIGLVNDYFYHQT